MSLITNCNLDCVSGMTRGLLSSILDVLEVQFHGEISPGQFLAQVGGMRKLGNPFVFYDCTIKVSGIFAFNNPKEPVVI